MEVLVRTTGRTRAGADDWPNVIGTVSTFEDEEDGGNTEEAPCGGLAGPVGRPSKGMARVGSSSAAAATPGAKWTPLYCGGGGRMALASSAVVNLAATDFGVFLGIVRHCRFVGDLCGGRFSGWVGLWRREGFGIKCRNCISSVWGVVVVVVGGGSGGGGDGEGVVALAPGKLSAKGLGGDSGCVGGGGGGGSRPPAVRPFVPGEAISSW